MSIPRRLRLAAGSSALCLAWLTPAPASAWDGYDPPSAKAADRYFVTDLGTSSNTIGGASGYAVNERGQVAFGKPASGAAAAYLWSPTRPNGIAGSAALLPTIYRNSPFGPPTPLAQRPHDINNFGQVTGWFGNSESGFLWTPSAANGSTGTLTTFGLSAGQSGPMAAYQINQSGQVVLGSSSRSEVFTPSTPNGTTGVRVALDSRLAAIAINDRGDVAGRRIGTSSGGGLFRPSVADESSGTFIESNDAIRDLTNTGLAATYSDTKRISDTNPPVLSQAINTMGLSHINDAGVAVEFDGIVARVDTPTGSFARYSKLTPLLEKHTGAGLVITQCEDINNLGQIVGQARFDVDGPNNVYSVLHAVLLTPLTYGDANVDQAVGFDDLGIVAQHYNAASGADWLAGDFTGDGAVSFDDLVLLAQRYGTPSTFAGDWALAQSLAPEPVTGLTLLAMRGLIVRRRSPLRGPPTRC